MAEKIRVLVVDDSALMRAMLAEIINSAADLQVVGTARSAMEAGQSLRTLKPDVMTLDVDMPQMDGLEFLAQVMKTQPMPVVMVSGLTERDSETTLRALELGAIDFVSKPKLDPVANIHNCADEICEKIRIARASRRHLAQRPLARHANQTSVIGAALPARVLQERLVLIGASTGGTEAIRAVLTALPEKMPGILIVQHMPEMFTGSFARRLDSLCALTVKEAQDGDVVKSGTVYIAPGHSHLLVRRAAGGFRCELSQAEPVNRHRPSVDVLFNAAAKEVGRNAVGVMLTGMGKDGAQGMLAMRQAGAWNICQDQESCVVWGMPREASINGAANEIASLCEIPARVIDSLRGK